MKSCFHNLHDRFTCCSLEAGGTHEGLQELGLGSFPGPVEELISQSSLQLHLLQPAGRRKTEMSAGTRLEKLPRTCCRVDLTIFTSASTATACRYWLAGPGSMQGEKVILHSERAIGEILNFSHRRYSSTLKPLPPPAPSSLPLLPGPTPTPY